MEVIKYAVCDDEPFMQEKICDYLSEYMKGRSLTSYCIDRFSNGRSLLKSDCDFHLIFLDIQMERPDGMETARILRQRGNRSLLIFVTVLKECVFDAFEVRAHDYLLKPLERDGFTRTMDRAFRFLAQQADKRILVQKGTLCEVILLSRILYCEVQGRKLYIHQSDGGVVDYYDKLEAFERRVDGRFFRCHRSYLVNLDHVRGCRDGRVRLSQGEEIPVSRLRERDLMQALLYYMKERDR
ncbi:MAG: response regulator transcription factor [Lachnospiraceae bacterium]|nr:response regulator transcription factor [Lachnospiraceae bacterium]